MNYLLPYLCIALATIASLFWSFLYFKYKDKYDDVITAMDKNKFMLPELFIIGFGFIELFRLDLKNEIGVKREKKIAEIYGEKLAPFYRYCVLGGQITYLLTIMPLGFGIGAMTNDITFVILILVAAMAIVTYLDLEINNAVEKKHDEILADYPVMLSRLTLLVNAGLVVREAWNRIAYTSEGVLYKEMQRTSEEIKNGMSDLDAFYNFAQRCSLKEIKKFSSILSQNIQKGGTDLAGSLRYMTDESWAEKKHRAKIKGETAGTKLMLPLMIMFSGILIMVVVPLFANML